MELAKIGERELISHIAKSFSKGKDTVIIGAGEDDCAVVDMGGEDYLLVTTDMLHEETDFPLQMTGWQIGWMSVAVNLSDLASKGARPIGVLMAMGMPQDTELEFMEDVVKGMDDCASKY